MIRGSATFTMVVSRITMKALRAITISACQWYGTLAKRAPSLCAGRAPSGCANVAIAALVPLAPPAPPVPRARPELLAPLVPLVPHAPLASHDHDRLLSPHYL